MATARQVAAIPTGLGFTDTYDETEAFKITPQTAARRRHHLEKQAAALGLRLEPAA